MSEKLAHWATALSALTAAITLGISAYNYQDNKNDEKIAQWQEVAVYEFILRNSLSTFSDIRTGYVVSAKQISAFDIPTEQIQDDSLRRIILNLQSRNLVRLRETGKYEVVVATYQPNPFEVMDIFKKEMHLKALYPVIKTKVLDVLNRECGSMNQEQLYRFISETVEIEQPIFINMLHGMRGFEVHKLDDDTWCTTYDSKKEE